MTRLREDVIAVGMFGLGVAFWVAVILCASSCEGSPSRVEPFRIFSAHGFDWYRDPADGPPCVFYRWERRSVANVAAFCGDPELIGCAVIETCHVVSMYNEATADLIRTSPEKLSHRRHELLHLGIGEFGVPLRHPVPTP